MTTIEEKAYVRDMEDFQRAEAALYGKLTVNQRKPPNNINTAKRPAQCRKLYCAQAREHKAKLQETLSEQRVELMIVQEDIRDLVRRNGSEVNDSQNVLHGRTLSEHGSKS
jgi:hypothetical protein